MGEHIYPIRIKGRRGPTPRGEGYLVGVRLPFELIKFVDAHIEKHGLKKSRGAAIRDIVARFAKHEAANDMLLALEERRKKTPPAEAGGTISNGVRSTAGSRSTPARRQRKHMSPAP